MSVVEYSAKDTFPASAPLTGTVSKGYRADDIVGTSTEFTAECKEGDWFYVSSINSLAKIKNIVSDTKLTLDREIGASQIATVTVTGTSGTANITITGTGTAYLATFDTDLTTTATNFVTTHAADIYNDENIIVTSSGAVLTFTSQIPGLSATVVSSNVSGDLNGTDATPTAASSLSGASAAVLPNVDYDFISIMPTGGDCDITTPGGLPVTHTTSEPVTFKGRKLPLPVIVDPTSTVKISYSL